jgi:uncharacterized OsmC-like protein
MNAEELRSLQSPLKSLYREEPAAALVTLTARGTLGPGRITCDVETVRGLVAAGLHPATGGDGLAACSGDLLLQALVACAGVTLGAVATALGLTIRGGKVSAEGDLDFRGTLGVSKEVPVGFREIRLQFDLDTDATEEQVAYLLRLTERYCVVYQTLKNLPALSASVEVPGEGGRDEGRKVGTPPLGDLEASESRTSPRRITSKDTSGPGK